MFAVRHSNNNGKDTGKSSSDSVRVSAYIERQEKTEWAEMKSRACKLDEIKNADNGTFLSRIIKKKLRLDKASLERYVKTHDDDVNPPKRPRDQTPARN